MSAHTITPLPPWGTLFTMLKSANCSPTCHVCHLPGTVETVIHPWRAHYSSVPVAIEGEHLPTEVIYDAELLSDQDPGEDNKQMSFPETVSDSLCRNSLVVQTHSFISCLGGLSQTMPQVKKSDVEVLVGVVTCGLQLWGQLDVLPNSLKWHCKQLMVEKLTLHSLATALVDISAVSVPIAWSLNSLNNCILP